MFPERSNGSKVLPFWFSLPRFLPRAAAVVCFALGLLLLVITVTPAGSVRNDDWGVPPRAGNLHIFLIWLMREFMILWFLCTKKI